MQSYLLSGPAPASSCYYHLGPRVRPADVGSAVGHFPRHHSPTSAPGGPSRHPVFPQRPPHCAKSPLCVASAALELCYLRREKRSAWCVVHPRGGAAARGCFIAFATGTPCNRTGRDWWRGRYRRLMASYVPPARCGCPGLFPRLAWNVSPAGAARRGGIRVRNSTGQAGDSGVSVMTLYACA